MVKKPVKSGIIGRFYVYRDKESTQVLSMIPNEVLDEGYFKCWQGLKKNFTGENKIEVDSEFYKNLGPQPIHHPRAAAE